MNFDRVPSGRTVVFHGTGDPREAAAEADLRACYPAAGFWEVDFMPEPQAPAIVDGALEQPESVGQIVDVGGSSLTSKVSQTMKEQFPQADHSFSEVFTAVADGLAIAARDNKSLY